IERAPGVALGAPAERLRVSVPAFAADVLSACPGHELRRGLCGDLLCAWARLGLGLAHAIDLFGLERQVVAAAVDDDHVTWSETAVEQAFSERVHDQVLDRATHWSRAKDGVEALLHEQVLGRIG